MSFNELPVEVLHHIFARCKRAEIHSLRGVNKTFLAVANEYFLTEIKLFFLKDEYETIADLVQDPGISRGLRSLTLAVDVFRPDLSFAK